MALADVKDELEYARCRICDDPITRLPGGEWEHAIDVRLDWDHLPGPEPEPRSTFDEPVVDRVREAMMSEGEWQLVGHRYYGPKATVKPKSEYL